jgi:hypothetical protein
MSGERIHERITTCRSARHRVPDLSHEPLQQPDQRGGRARAHRRDRRSDGQGRRRARGRRWRSNAGRASGVALSARTCPPARRSRARCPRAPARSSRRARNPTSSSASRPCSRKKQRCGPCPCGGQGPLQPPAPGSLRASARADSPAAGRQAEQYSCCDHLPAGVGVPPNLCAAATSKGRRGSAGAPGHAKAAPRSGGPGPRMAPRQPGEPTSDPARPGRNGAWHQCAPAERPGRGKCCDPGAGLRPCRRSGSAAGESGPATAASTSSSPTPPRASRRTPVGEARRTARGHQSRSRPTTPARRRREHRPAVLDRHPVVDLSRRHRRHRRQPLVRSAG